MAFLNSGGAPTIFLEIGDQTKKKLFRPLADKPVAIWGHNIQSAETAAQVGTSVERIKLRDYRFETCTAIDRRGTGCALHNMVDPGWNYLPPDNQTNRKGQRVDFPMKPVYLMPVWSYSEGTIKVLRGGNQVYEEMDKWDTQGRNIRECDWMVWKEGQRKQTKYMTSRQDATSFTATVTEEQVKQAMAEAMQEYAPLPQDRLLQAIQVLSPEEAIRKHMEAKARSNPALAAAPTQPALPAASPFGQFAALPPAQAPATPAAPAAPSMADLLAALPEAQRAQFAMLLAASGQVPVASPGVAPQAPLVQTAPTTNSVPGVAPQFPLVQTTTPVSGAPTTGMVSAPPPAITADNRPPLAPGFTDLRPLEGKVVDFGGAAATPGQVAATLAAAAQNPTSPVGTGSVTYPANPADYVLESGKYAGEKLGAVAAKDPNYLKFYRSSQKDNKVKEMVTAVLEAKPATPPPAPSTPSTPAPTTPPVQAQGTPVQPPMQAPMSANEQETLVKDCRQLISSTPKFQGTGLSQNLIPFLRKVSGGRYDFTEWSIADLQKLKAALLEENGAPNTGV